MATGKDVKVLTAEDKKVIGNALRLYQKSMERAGRAAANGTIKTEFERLAQNAQSLANHVEYGQIDLGS